MDTFNLDFKGVLIIGVKTFYLSTGDRAEAFENLTKIIDYWCKGAQSDKINRSTDTDVDPKATVSGNLHVRSN